MTEDLALPGRVALTMMGVSIDRRRRILELRAERDRLATELSRVEAAIATEEADLEQENATVGELFDQWQRILDGKFAEARKDTETSD
jgi:hypothetical protein